MKLSQQLNVKQVLKLRQILTPKLIQMLKLFNLPYQDLVDQVTSAVDENVFLEVVRFDQLGGYASAIRGNQKIMDRDFTEFIDSAKKRGGTSFNINRATGFNAFKSKGP